jgi:hypothetical protein
MTPEKEVSYSTDDPSYRASCRMFERFEKETGKPVLRAWYEYEEWLERQPDLDDYVAILESDRKRESHGE